MEKQVIGSITVVSPEGTERQVVLKDGDSVKIGRGDVSDVVIDDIAASRMHATFSASKSGIALQDHSSLNGTFLNGERVLSARELSSQDVVNIGSTKIMIDLKAESAGMSGADGMRGRTAQLQPVNFTVMIASAASYNEYLKMLPPNDTMQMLENWTVKMTEIVEANDGKIDKILGTSIVAIWVGREAKPLAVSAAKAALAVKRETMALSRSEQWGYHRDYPWKATVVLSSGLGLKGAAVGGTDDEMDCTLLGEPVNLAFRLEEMISKLGQDLIIPDGTAELIKDEFQLQKIIAVKLKGDDDRVEIHSFAGL